MTFINPLGKPAAPATPGAVRGKDRRRAADKGEAPSLAALFEPLAQEVEQLTDELLKEPNGENLERYKRSVRKFLDLATRELMQLNTESAFGFKQRLFSTITRVDLHLGELADSVLGRQQDMGRIQNLVEQVKGLLVDLYR
ncbi:DUF327 family protein [bacterium]|nr:DUF327 family protein [bacterium]